MAKNQLNEMKSLINRMENPQSGWATLLQESLDEYKDPNGLGRMEFEKFDDFIRALKPIGGRFIGIGYIQNYPVKNVYPDKPINGVATRDVLSQYQQGLANDNRLSSKLAGFLQNPEMTEPKGKAANFKSLGQSFKSIKEGNPFVSLLKVTTYNFQWRDYAKAVADKNQKIGDLRVSHGFGEPEDTYAEDDWRRNPEFGGVGRFAAYVPKKNDDGSDFHYPYSNLLNPDFNVYGDNDEHGEIRSEKRVIKALIPTGNGNAIYCSIDNKGEIDDISKSLYNILGGPQSSFAAAKLADEMAEDEKVFRTEAAKLNNETYNSQWITDNVAYMVGTGILKEDHNGLAAGTTVPYRFINKNIVLECSAEINGDELAKVVETCAERAYADVMKNQRASDAEFYQKAQE